jgi:WD40 repeat protein
LSALVGCELVSGIDERGSVDLPATGSGGGGGAAGGGACAEPHTTVGSGGAGGCPTTFMNPRPVPGLETLGDIGGFVSRDGKTAWLHDDDISVARWGCDGRFEAPVPVDINSPAADYAGSLTGDNAVLYFLSERPPSQSVDVWRALWNGTNLGPPERIGEASSPGVEFQVFAAANGNLYIARQRLNGAEIVVALANPPDFFQAVPVFPGAPAGFQIGPVLRDDGLVLFYGAYSGQQIDVWVTCRTGPMEPFSLATAQPLMGLNDSGAEDFPVSLSANGRVLYFQTRRKDGITADLYMADLVE